VLAAAPPTFDAAEPPTVVTAAPPIFDAAEPPTVVTAAPATVVVSEPAPPVVQALARVDTPPPSRLSALAPAQVLPDVPAADVHTRRRRILLAGPALLIAGVSLAAGLRARRTAPPAAPGRTEPPPPEPAASKSDVPAAAPAVPEARSPPLSRRRRAQPPAAKRLATASASGSRQSGPPRSPADAEQAYRRGNERLLAGDAASASQAYQQAIFQDPTLAVAHRGLGLAEAQLGNRRASVRALRRYLQIAPAAPDREPIRTRIRLLTRKS
jgi:hypothetical protein